jgi:hypothetical protein
VAVLAVADQVAQALEPLVQQIQAVAVVVAIATVVRVALALLFFLFQQQDILEQLQAHQQSLHQARTQF